MKSDRRFIMICNAIAAVCFGISSYGHFYNGSVELGALFACIATLQLGVMIYTNKEQ